MTEERRRLRLRIHGRVQGVWYRGWTVAEAERLGVDGWVRNGRDGTVEALLSGPAASVEAMLARCRQGPPAARVERIEIQEESGQVAPGFVQVASD